MPKVWRHEKVPREPRRDSHGKGEGRDRPFRAWPYLGRAHDEVLVHLLQVPIDPARKSFVEFCRCLERKLLSEQIRLFGFEYQQLEWHLDLVCALCSKVCSRRIEASSDSK